MNRNHLAIFYAVARSGSFTAAAEQLSTSQPALSMQVKELEKRVGVRLLERLPRGVQLTDAGKTLFEYAQRIAAMEASAMQAMRDIRSLKQGAISIGCSLTIGTYLLPDLLAEFRKKHGGIRTEVRIANTAAIQNLIGDGVLDIGLTEGYLDDELLEGNIFQNDRLIPVAPPGHPLISRKSVSLRDFAEFPLILREQGSGTRAVLEMAAMRAGVTLTPLMELASPESIKAMVIAGNGVAVMSELAVRLEIQTGALYPLELSDCRLHRPLHTVLRRGGVAGPALRAFIALLPQMPAASGVPGKRRKSGSAPA